MVGKSDWINFEGTISWANSKYGGIFELDPKFGYYKAHVYLTPESWDKYKKAGIQTKPKQDEEGDYVQFKRKPVEMRKGKPVEKGPPKVFFAKGITPTKNIGNGSKCIVNVNVYDTDKGVGHRLEEVTITELVEFEAKGGGGGSNIMDRVQLVDDPTEDNTVPFDTDETELNDEIPFGGEPQEETLVVKKKNPFRR